MRRIHNDSFIETSFLVQLQQLWDPPRSWRFVWCSLLLRISSEEDNSRKIYRTEYCKCFLKQMSSSYGDEHGFVEIHRFLTLAPHVFQHIFHGQALGKCENTDIFIAWCSHQTSFRHTFHLRIVASCAYVAVRSLLSKCHKMVLGPVFGVIT